jgi:TRAP-type C4-dicarboxylate transport system permease small subunit
MTLRALDRLEETIIGTLIAAATLIIFVAVLHRYGLSSLGSLVVWSKSNGYQGLSDAARWVFSGLNSIRLTWAQELCIYLFVWMAKFGAAYGVRTGIHVGVDILVNRLPETARRNAILFGLLCGALFTGFVGWLGARLVVHLAHYGQTSAVLEAPMWLVYLCLPLGSFLMCFRFLQVAWHFHKTGELPQYNAAHVTGIEAPAPGGAR